jgi:hypothetical protein
VLYGQALAQGGEHERALYELDTALLGKMPAKEAGTAHALKATSLQALGRGAEASKEKEAALKADPENAIAKELKF